MPDQRMNLPEKAMSVFTMFSLLFLQIPGLPFGTTLDGSAQSRASRPACRLWLWVCLTRTLLATLYQCIFLLADLFKGDNKTHIQKGRC